MASVRKYAGLPDLDLAPDIYETPDLTDDLSNLPTTTARSESPGSAYEHGVDPEDRGIDRHPINQDEARTHFLPKGEQGPSHFSRIVEKRRSHKVDPTRRKDVITEISVSSDDETESVDRKLARLRREVSEVKDEIEKRGRGAEQDSVASGQAEIDAQQSDNLDRLLDSISNPKGGDDDTASRRLARLLDTSTSSKPLVAEGEQAPRGRNETKSSSTKIPAESINFEEHELATIAEFDERLSLLERSLGIDAVPLSMQEQTPRKTVLPTLDLLDKQLSTLSTSNDTILDSVKGRIKDLSLEAELLERRRGRAQAAGTEAVQSAIISSNEEFSSSDASQDAEQTSKINALYATLSTIDSLAPNLPSILDRLRSLRDLHSGAAIASQSLAELEARQSDMRQELHEWREGLEKVEIAISQSQETLKDNTDVIENWVKELETRVEKFT